MGTPASESVFGASAVDFIFPVVTVPVPVAEIVGRDAVGPWPALISGTRAVDLSKRTTAPLLVAGVVAVAAAIAKMAA